MRVSISWHEDSVFTFGDILAANFSNISCGHSRELWTRMVWRGDLKSIFPIDLFAGLFIYSLNNTVLV